MKAKITEVPAAPEKAITAAADATVESLRQGVATITAETARQETKMSSTIEATQSKMKEGMEKAMKTAEEIVSFNQGNLEALIKSGQIWAAGVQDLSKHIASTAQASFEESMSAFKAMTSVKSIKDAIDLQTSFARSTLEKTIAESSKLTDASLKLTEQTLAPITARVTLAVEKIGKAA
jgi:phasin family protein